MQKLKYQTLYDLKPHIIDILRAHSTTVAFRRVLRNDYMVAARPPDMFELRNKLFPKTNQRYQQPDHVHPLTNRPANNR